MKIINEFVVPWLASLITIFVFVMGTYQKEKNKKKIRKWCLIVSILIILVGGIYIGYSKLQEKKEDDLAYKDLYGTILDEISNGQYSNAIQKLNVQINHIKDDKEYKEFVLLKGICLLNEAMSKNDYTERNRKLEETLSVIKEFQSKSLRISDYEKIQLEIILGFSYLYLNDNTYKNKLEDTKKFLEGIRQNNLFEEVRDIDLFLGLYYEDKYNKDSNYDNISNTIHYYERLTHNDIDFKILINKDVNESYTIKVANYYLKAGIAKVGENEKDLIFSDKNSSLVREAIKSIEEALSRYNKVISNCDLRNNSNIYYECLINQGACYCWLVVLGKENEDYGIKAYENFRKFICIDQEEYDYILDGMYVYFWLGLPQKEADMIIKRYKRLLKKYEDSMDIAMVAEIKYQIAVSYQKMAIRYQRKTYYDKGKVFLDQICLEFNDYFNDKRKQMIEDLKKEYADMAYLRNYE